MNKQENYEIDDKKAKEYKEIIGRKMQIARRNADLTQSDLAGLINVSTEHISNMERGESFGSTETNIKICNALNISANFLFGNTINNNLHTIDFIADDEFIENYLKLNSHNKRTISIIVTALVDAQERKIRK